MLRFTRRSGFEFAALDANVGFQVDMPGAGAGGIRDRGALRTLCVHILSKCQHTGQKRTHTSTDVRMCMYEGEKRAYVRMCIFNNPRRAGRHPFPPGGGLPGPAPKGRLLPGRSPGEGVPRAPARRKNAARRLRDCLFGNDDLELESAVSVVPKRIWILIFFRPQGRTLDSRPKCPVPAHDFRERCLGDPNVYKRVHTHTHTLSENRIHTHGNVFAYNMVPLCMCTCMSMHACSVCVCEHGCLQSPTAAAAQVGPLPPGLPGPAPIQRRAASCRAAPQGGRPWGWAGAALLPPERGKRHPLFARLPLRRTTIWSSNPPFSC